MVTCDKSAAELPQAQPASQVTVATGLHRHRRALSAHEFFNS